VNNNERWNIRNQRRRLKHHHGVISATIETQFDRASNILNDYLMAPLETCKTLDYWKMRVTDSRFVKLAIMARDYLIAQATSVPSENIFSVAKHTISLVRNRLDEKKVRASLCLKSWYDAGLLENEHVNLLANMHDMIDS